MNFYEPASRVPLIVHAPNRLRAPALRRSLVSLLDLLPTLSQRSPTRRGAGRTPHGIDGRSLLPAARRARTAGPKAGAGHRRIPRRGRDRAHRHDPQAAAHKFVHSPADPDQLYDLIATIRMSATNLAAAPEPRQHGRGRVARRGRAALGRWHAAARGRTRQPAAADTLVNAALRNRPPPRRGTSSRCAMPAVSISATIRNSTTWKPWRDSHESRLEYDHVTARRHCPDAAAPPPVRTSHCLCRCCQNGCARN
jgi:hypothetical protein